MEELRDKVLQAENVILQLAEELAKAKGITEQVKIVEQKLNDASKAVEKSISALEETRNQLTKTEEEIQSSLNAATKLLQQTNENLVRDVRTLSAEISQVLSQQNEELKKVSQWLRISLILTGFVTLTSIAIIIILLIR